MLIVYVIVGVVVLAILTFAIASHHRTFKMTSRTSGTVISSQEREMKNEKARWHETEVHFRYRAGGADHEMKQILRGKLAARFPAGKSVPVRYDPAEPQLAALAVRG